MVSLRYTTVAAVTTAIESLFACHGIQSVVRSDSRPQLAAKEFAEFAKSYGFRHLTSSLKYPQSNGEVERMVGTVNDKIRKEKDRYLSLIIYRDITGASDSSPAQL